MYWIDGLGNICWCNPFTYEVKTLKSKVKP